MEELVSDHLGKMSILWIDVEDVPSKHSQRALIEQNSIALLSGRLSPIDIPSKTWLGRHSIENLIRKSGLWNLNYVDNSHRSSFLDVLEERVEATIRLHSHADRVGHGGTEGAATP